MYKFGFSLAILALISNASAVELRDNLWSDDDEETETLASIQAAEKAHGKQFHGIS